MFLRCCLLYRLNIKAMKSRQANILISLAAINQVSKVCCQVSLPPPPPSTIVTPSMIAIITAREEAMIRVIQTALWILKKLLC